MLTVIEKSWGWTGLKPKEIVGQNAFGNFMIQDESDRFWRICPEELNCEVVAEDRAALDALSQDPEFVLDWEMQALVALAREAVGNLAPERSYCLKIPGVLGGTYEASNLSTIRTEELIAAAGDIAEQIRDLPDGAQVRFRFTD